MGLRIKLTQWKENLKKNWYILKRNPLSIVGFVIILFLIALAILAPLIAPYDPEKINITNRFAPPSLHHLMGTDQYGIDIFSRVIYAARIDLLIAIFGVVIAVIIGCFLGAIAGFFGGAVDNIIMRIMDSQQAFPAFVIAMVVSTVLGSGVFNLILVIAFVNFPIFTRLLRAEIITAKSSTYCEAARCVGNSNFRIIFKHLFPNCLSPIYVTGSLLIGAAIMLTASLSFVGLGITPPTPEWGLMVAQGSKYIISGRWWMSIFPGFMIFISMFAWNLFGDGLQDVFDPKRR